MYYLCVPDKRESEFHKESEFHTLKVSAGTSETVALLSLLSQPDVS